MKTILEFVSLINIIYSIVVLIIFYVLWRFFSQKGNSKNNNMIVEPISINYVLGGSSKCFDCERSIPNELKWMSAPTKCFDCEKQMIRPEFSHPVKTFSAEGGLLEINS